MANATLPGESDKTPSQESHSMDRKRKSKARSSGTRDAMRAMACGPWAEPKARFGWPVLVDAARVRCTDRVLVRGKDALMSLRSRGLEVLKS